jgi:hypothetical protein
MGNSKHQTLPSEKMEYIVESQFIPDQDDQDQTAKSNIMARITLHCLKSVSSENLLSKIIKLLK